MSKWWPEYSFASDHHTNQKQKLQTLLQQFKWEKDVDSKLQMHNRENLEVMQDQPVVDVHCHAAHIQVLGGAVQMA